MLRMFSTLCWELLTRKPWLIGCNVLYLALISVVTPLLPNSIPTDKIGAFLIIPLIGSLPFVLGVFAQGLDNRLDLSASGFPRRYFLLPVSTTMIATPSLFLCAVWLIGGWFLLSTFVLRPEYGSLPQLWPGLLAASGFAWIQAVAWMPVPAGILRWSRIMFLAILCPSIVIGGGFLGSLFDHHKWNFGYLSMIYACFLFLAWTAAYCGVCLARRGVGTWISSEGAPQSSVEVVKKPVRASSPLAAQVWFELRLRFVNAIILGVCFLLVPGMVHITDRICRDKPYLIDYLGWTPVVEIVGPALFSQVWLLVVPVFVALFSGVDFGRFPHFQGGAGCPRYIAILPVTNRLLVSAKWIAALIGMFILWSYLMLLAVGWGIWSGHLAEMSNRLYHLGGSTIGAVAMVAGLFLLAVLVSWVWLISGIWVGLLRFFWVPPFLYFSLISAVSITVVNWQPTWNRYLIVTIVVFLAAKALGVTVVIRRLLQEKQFALSTLLGLVVAWIMMTAAVAGLFGLAYPREWLIPATVVAVMPLAQCLLSPLAMAWERNEG